MADSKGEKPYDPFEALRGLRDAGMDAWAKAMTEAIHTDAYAQSSGAMLDAYLTASAPFYESLQKAIAQALQQLNLPSRADFVSLSERLTNIETRLDDMDAKLDRVLAKKSSPVTPAVAARSSRKEAR
ncbi:MAG: hypothetical protein JO061_22145 [Acidobacteriaceae bacterium]|nr:hypothetical protein [Acidobacteriaceae bacterium]